MQEESNGGLQRVLVMLQRLFHGLQVPQNVQMLGPGALAALSALCMYLQRANAVDELASPAQQVRLHLLMCKCLLSP